MKQGWIPAVVIGVVAGVDNIGAALAMAALIFTGPLVAGAGLGMGIILLGGAILALVVSRRSGLPNSVALVQESTIAILAAAILAMAAQPDIAAEAKVATAIAIMGTASVVTGVLMWSAGRLRFAGLLRFLPYPVVAGALAGTGWLLIDGAINMLTGQRFGAGLVPLLVEVDVIWRLMPAIVFAAVLAAVLDRFAHPLIMPLTLITAVLAFFAMLQVSGLSVEAARDLGHLPSTVVEQDAQAPTLGLLLMVDWWAVLAVWPTYLVIAGLTMIGLALNVSGLELLLGRDLDVNAEFRATGVANTLSGVVGGPSGYVGMSMTILAERIGSTGRAGGLAAAAVMLAGVVAGASLVLYVPVFVAGGFLLFLGGELVHLWLVKTRKTLPLSEWSIVVVILLTIALVGLMEGLALGLLVSSAVFVVNYSRLPVVRMQASATDKRSTVDRSPSAARYLGEHGDAIEIVQLQGYLFFGTAERVVNIVRQRVAATEKPALRFILLDFRNVSGIDSAAVTGFLKIRRLAETDGIKIFFTGVPDHLRDMLALAGIDDRTHHLLNFDTDLDHALEKAEEDVLADMESRLAEDVLHHFNAIVGDHDRLGDLIDVMTRLEAKPGDRLIRQGETASDVYFIASGRVRVEIVLPDGETLRLRTMLSGAVVGEIALYLGQERTADVVVEVPSTIFRLSGDELARMEREDPALASLTHRLLASTLAEKLSMANKSIELDLR